MSLNLATCTGAELAVAYQAGKVTELQLLEVSRSRIIEVGEILKAFCAVGKFDLVQVLTENQARLAIGQNGQRKGKSAIKRGNGSRLICITPPVQRPSNGKNHYMITGEPEAWEWIFSNKADIEKAIAEARAVPDSTIVAEAIAKADKAE